MLRLEKLVIRFAFYTRIIVIILQYISNIIVPDHDADAFLYPKTLSNNNTFADEVIQHFLGGFVRWDAQYFMHIAKYGYTYEKTLAFFPLYPMTVKVLSFIINTCFPLISFDSTLLLTFVGLNIMLFIISAVVLLRLTAIIFDKDMAYKSALLFCINPASIFFSAPYAECMFYFLTLQSILNCFLLYKKYCKAFKICYFDIVYVVPISLSSLVRSNGILNIGFLLYIYICINIKYWPRKGFITKTNFIVKNLVIICILTVICLVPFFIYQIYCFHMFCTNFKMQFPSSILIHSARNEFVLPGQFNKYNQSWCYDKIPLAYSYVQKHYWNVGFLRYYELKQLPQFLLAAPILIILIKMSFQYIIHNANNNIIDIFSFDKLLTKKTPKHLIFNPVLNVFVIHILFLVLFCALFVHIQVSTRLLCSSSPILYWFCADLIKDKTLDDFKNIFYKLSLKEYAVISYFLSYFIIGTVLFCNFLPWT